MLLTHKQNDCNLFFVVFCLSICQIKGEQNELKNSTSKGENNTGMTFPSVEFEPK